MKGNSKLMVRLFCVHAMLFFWGCAHTDLIYKEVLSGDKSSIVAEKGVFAAQEYYRIKKTVRNKSQNIIHFECNTIRSCNPNQEFTLFRHAQEPPFRLYKLTYDDLGEEHFWRAVTRISKDSFFYFDQVIEKKVNENCEYHPVTDEEWYHLDKAINTKPIKNSCCSAARVYLKDIIGFVQCNELGNVGNTINGNKK